MKSFSKMRVVTGVALGAVLALSYVEGTFAADCAAANTFYDGATGSGTSGVVVANADCTACPTGTTAAAAPSTTRTGLVDGATPGAGLKTYCEGIAAGYYGTAGNVASAHATGTGTGTCTGSTANTCPNPCPQGTYSAAGATTCTLCPTGTTTASAGGAAFCAQTAPNYVGKAGVAASAHAKNIAGTAGSSPQKCPTGSEHAGSSSDTDFSDCVVESGAYLQTKAASATDATGVVIKECPAGYYCDAQDSSNAAIPITTAVTTAVWDGVYAASLPTNAGVTACAAGKTSLAGSSASGDCTNCLAATFSPFAASASCTACPAESSSSAGDDQRQDCTDTFYSGQDTAGFYLASSTKSTYSNGAQALTLTACPIGTTSASQTFVFDGVTSNAATFCGAVEAGYYGKAGAATSGVYTAHANTGASGANCGTANADCPTACAAGKTSASITTGTSSASDCVAPATPTAATPAAADSAGAAMPIAAAVAAMAMPLLI